jgi:hypothetical protein
MPRRTIFDPKAIQWKGQFNLTWTIGGKVYHDVADNALYDLGEQQLLEVYFRGATAPTDFKLGLINTGYSLTETHTMTNVGGAELTNSNAAGYTARQTLTKDATGWPTSALNSGDWQITSRQVEWTATGAWTGTASFIFLMTGGNTTPADTTGTIIAVAALSPTRQLGATGDKLQATYALKLQ